jgi:hypothetical protein
MSVANIAFVLEHLRFSGRHKLGHAAKSIRGSAIIYCAPCDATTLVDRRSVCGSSWRATPAGRMGGGMYFIAVP